MIGRARQVARVFSQELSRYSAKAPREVIERSGKLARGSWKVLRHEIRHALGAHVVTLSPLALRRMRWILWLLLLGYSLIAVRLFQLQVLEARHWRELARRQQTRVREVSAERGRILLHNRDRLVPAAVSLIRGSLLVEGDPERDVTEFMAKLDRALRLTPEERHWLFERLRGDGLRRSFYFRRRDLTPAQVEQMAAEHDEVDEMIEHLEKKSRGCLQDF